MKIEQVITLKPLKPKAGDYFVPHSPINRGRFSRGERMSGEKKGQGMKRWKEKWGKGKRKKKRQRKQKEK